MSSNELLGTCLCETVRWRVAGQLTPFAHCHCSICRKSHGTPFATYMAANAQDVYWLSGEDAITRFESSPGFNRQFCKHCGSVVPGVASDGHMFVPPGCADVDPGVRAKIHIFVNEKVPWYEITDSLRQFDAFPNSVGPETLYTGAPDTVNDALSGSCACGGIAFEVMAPLTVARNCHCTRCRRGRSAPHASNGFASSEAVQFVRGEDLLVDYKVPDAQFFTQTFCRQCGSLMPRVSQERGVANIPMGSLDGQPNITPGGHIYTKHKAPWHEITDALPQFPEGAN